MALAIVVDSLGKALVDGSGNAVTVLLEEGVEGGWAREPWWPEGGWGTEPWGSVGLIHYVETMDLGPSLGLTIGDESTLYEDGGLDATVELSLGEALAGTYREQEFISVTPEVGFGAKFRLKGWVKDVGTTGLWTPEDEL